MPGCTNQKKNAEHCTCTYPCDKRGNCCACVTYHRAKGQVPGCFFSKNGEAAYDRSIAALARDHGIC